MHEEKWLVRVCVSCKVEETHLQAKVEAIQTTESYHSPRNEKMSHFWWTEERMWIPCRHQVDHAADPGNAHADYDDLVR